MEATDAENEKPQYVPKTPTEDKIDTEHGKLEEKKPTGVSKVAAAVCPNDDKNEYTLSGTYAIVDDSKDTTKKMQTLSAGSDPPDFGSICEENEPVLACTLALAPLSRSQEISPGAVWEGDSLGEDTGTVTFANDEETATEQTPSSQAQQHAHLISAERVQDPVLVSASIVDCLCCPYGRMTVVPALAGCMGSALSFLAAFMPFAECSDEETDDGQIFLAYGIIGIDTFSNYATSDTVLVGFILGLISGTGGAIAFALSTGASCRTFPEWLLKLLGATYLVLAVTSILMLVALASPNVQCDALVWGGAFAIVAFFMYLGAGIFTLRMIKKKDVNSASVCTCCPYGNLTALPSAFGFIGTTLIAIAISVAFVDDPAIAMDKPSENVDLPYGPYDYPIVDVCRESENYGKQNDGRCSVYLYGAQGDPALTFALTMSIIAAFVGTVASVLGVVPGCQKVPSKAFKILGFIYILLGPMCLLTLVAFASKECGGECSLSTGGILAICAFFAFGGACLSAFYLNKKISSQTTSESNV